MRSIAEVYVDPLYTVSTKVVECFVSNLDVTAGLANYRNIVMDRKHLPSI